MSIEGCNFDAYEEDFCLEPLKSSQWNGRTVTLEEDRSIHQIHKNYLIEPLKRSVGGSVEVNADSEEGSSLTGEVHVSIKDEEDGSSITVEAEANVQNDSDGGIKADGSIKVSYEMEF